MVLCGEKEKPKNQNSKQNFHGKLLLNLVQQNPWLSVFYKFGWSSFNRTARLTSIVFASSLVSIGNVIWYYDPDKEGLQVRIENWAKRSIKKPKLRKQLQWKLDQFNFHSSHGLLQLCKH